MSRGTWGILVLFVLSLLLGLLSGEFFFRLWLETVPTGARTSFLTTTSHAAFLWRGAIVGVAFFLWGLLAPMIRLPFRKRPEVKVKDAPVPSRP